LLILRHDVEVSLKAATEMARVETQHGIRSTYLVHLANRFYNVFDRVNLDSLIRLRDMGHEIGLHYDLSRYVRYGRPIRETLLAELGMLQKLIRRRVRTFAMHNPSLHKLDPVPKIRGYINAYSFNEDNDFLYVSDSCLTWRIQDAHRLVAEVPERVQLLIHPFQWTPGERNRYSLLDKWFQRIEIENQEYRRQWKRLWATLPYVKRYDKQIKRQRHLLDFD